MRATNMKQIPAKTLLTPMYRVALFSGLLKSMVWPKGGLPDGVVAGLIKGLNVEAILLGWTGLCNASAKKLNCVGEREREGE